MLRRRAVEARDALLKIFAAELNVDPASGRHVDDPLPMNLEEHRAASELRMLLRTRAINELARAVASGRLEAWGRQPNGSFLEVAHDFAAEAIAADDDASHLIYLDTKKVELWLGQFRPREQGKPTVTAFNRLGAIDLQKALLKQLRELPAITDAPDRSGCGDALTNGAKRRGRPPLPLGFNPADAPSFVEMKRLLDAKQARSHTAAARMILAHLPENLYQSTYDRLRKAYPNWAKNGG